MRGRDFRLEDEMEGGCMAENGLEDEGRVRLEEVGGFKEEVDLEGGDKPREDPERDLKLVETG
jgi:hypothetical protein